MVNDDIIEILEKAFAYGSTDREACLLANIGEATLYKYQKENPKFIERKQQLKDLVKNQARVNVAKAIVGGDKEASQWYLDRKARGEFSTRTEVENPEQSIALKELQEGMKQLADNIKKDA